jgi:hypothetical protein
LIEIFEIQIMLERSEIAILRFKYQSSNVNNGFIIAVFRIEI